MAVFYCIVQHCSLLTFCFNGYNIEFSNRGVFLKKRLGMLDSESNTHDPKLFGEIPLSSLWGCSSEG